MKDPDIRVTTSVWLSLFSTQMELSGRYQPPTGTTINDAMNVPTPTTTEIAPVRTKYVMFGMGGVYLTQDMTQPAVNKHDPRDVIPRSPLPLMAVPIDEDGIGTEPYFLRREEVIGGEIYAVYYAMEIGTDTPYNLSLVKPGNNGATTNYVQSSTRMEPRDVDRPKFEGIDSRTLRPSEYVVAAGSLMVSLNTDQYQKMRSAAVKVLGNAQFAYPSEAFIFFGSEHEVPIQRNGVTEVYTEVGNAHPRSMLAFQPKMELDISLDIGTGEPVVVEMEDE